ILRGEFEELSPRARLAYAAAALCADQDAPATERKHLLSIAGGSHLEASTCIDVELKGILVPASDSMPLLRPRHSLIGRWIAQEVIPQPLVKEAIASYLVACSPDINPHEIRRRTATYIAYRGLINAEHLHRYLGSDADVDDVYAIVRKGYDNDYLFWLQYSIS